jgi:hypothetical protein
MKNLFARVIILAAAAAAFGIQVQAQSGQQYRANVPFDFTAAGRSYTAGSYSVGKVSQISDSGAIMLIDRRTGHAKVIGMNRSRSSNQTAKLVFVKNGLRYALKEVITPDFGIKVKQPKQVIARGTNDPEIIELALN